MSVLRALTAAQPKCALGPKTSGQLPDCPLDHMTWASVAPATDGRRDLSAVHRYVKHCWATALRPRYDSGTEKVPQSTCATKTLPNFRMNSLVRFASKPLFYWLVPSNCSESSLVLFVQFVGFWGSFLGSLNDIFLMTQDDCPKSQESDWI